MEQLSTLHDVLLEELKDLYSSEQQILKALPKAIEKCKTPALKEALGSHLKETQEQVVRLQKVSELIGEPLQGEQCEAMEGILRECEEILTSQEVNSDLLDVMIIGACQRVEHYEIAGYGTARTLAEVLGLEEVEELLQEILDEEKDADEKLTQVALEEVLPLYANEGEEDEMLDEDDEDTLRQSH